MSSKRKPPRKKEVSLAELRSGRRGYEGASHTSVLRVEQEFRCTIQKNPKVQKRHAGKNGLGQRMKYQWGLGTLPISREAPISHPCEQFSLSKNTMCGLFTRGSKILPAGGHGRSKGPAVGPRPLAGAQCGLRWGETNGIRAWILPSQLQEASET